MAEVRLSGVRVAVLVTDGFEQVEMTSPREALEEAGARTHLVSPKEGQVKGWKFTEWGDSFPVDQNLATARPEEYEALLLPGGVQNPDKLRVDDTAVAFAQAFLDSGKPVAVICHGPWTLIETGRLRGRRMTSWPSLQTDLMNAGVEWLDEEVVVDGNIVSSRKPDDLPAFNREMVRLFGVSRGRERQAA